MLALAVASVSLAAPREPPALLGLHPAVADAISQVATPTLVYELEGLSGERPITVSGQVVTLTTRHSYQTQAISLATQYAFEQLAEAGLAVSFHPYTYSGYALRNVVGEKRGAAVTDSIFILSAHLDSISNAPSSNPAPGADDNASGVAGVLAAARVLAPFCFSHTLRFVLFTGEEQGLRGSDAYAARALALGERISGVINLDMIGYRTGDPAFDAYARSGTAAGAAESRLLADVISDVVATYGLTLLPRRLDVDVYPLRGGSDQWPFLARGYPAILVIEDYARGDFTPFYHTTGDRVSTLDLAYLQAMTRASIAALAHVGGLISQTVTLSGTVTERESHLPVAALVSAGRPDGGAAFAAETSADGTFRLELPAGWYVLAVTPTLGHYPAVSPPIGVCTGATVVDLRVEAWANTYLPLVARSQP
jgi:hypothetical protein